MHKHCNMVDLKNYVPTLFVYFIHCKTTVTNLLYDIQWKRKYLNNKIVSKLASKIEINEQLLIHVQYSFRTCHFFVNCTSAISFLFTNQLQGILKPINPLQKFHYFNKYNLFQKLSIIIDEVSTEQLILNNSRKSDMQTTKIDCFESRDIHENERFKEFLNILGK